MVSIRKLTSLLATVLVASLVAMPARALVVHNSETPNGNRVLRPINLAILIQDDLVPGVSNELPVTRDFIRSLPRGSRVMIGYITSGTLQVRQPFTSNLGEAAGTLRILASSISVSPFNPYVEVLEALRKFSPEDNVPNVLLLVSDGLDTSRGTDSASVLRSIDLDRAISEAKRRGVTIYSFYAPSVGLTSRYSLAASHGQGSLNRVSGETGGKAFFQGTTGFVTFNPYFESLVNALNQRYSLRD
ncbi:MAG TPA: hypothetical protein VFV34_03550 [Blastocatellia bacterium]|nr:hypothetical protein [Blastocatellia bacterium]